MLNLPGPPQFAKCSQTLKTFNIFKMLLGPVLMGVRIYFGNFEIDIGILKANQLRHNPTKQMIREERKDVYL